MKKIMLASFCVVLSLCVLSGCSKSITEDVSTTLPETETVSEAENILVQTNVNTTTKKPASGSSVPGSNRSGNTTTIPEQTETEPSDETETTEIQAKPEADSIEWEEDEDGDDVGGDIEFEDDEDANGE